MGGLRAYPTPLDTLHHTPMEMMSPILPFRLEVASSMSDLATSVAETALATLLASASAATTATNSHETFNAITTRYAKISFKSMGVFQGVAMDALKYHPGPPCPTLLHPAGRSPLKRPNGRFRGGLPAGQAACNRLLPFWTPHDVGLCFSVSVCLSRSRTASLKNHCRMKI
jgi:hypothetical protein